MEHPVAHTIVCGDEPQAWTALGFAVRQRACAIGPVTVVLDGGGGGIRAVLLDGAAGADPDGLPLRPAPRRAPRGPASHPVGAIAVDHVVALTPDRDRTVAALASAGIPARRLAGPPDVPRRMAFHQLGPLILEVAERPDAGNGTATFWGLVVVVDDLDAAAARLGTGLGAVKPAVQPGRWIATVRPVPGLGTALALMTPRA